MEEERFCSICGIGEKDASKFYYNTIYGENLCNKHYIQLNRFGKIKDIHQPQHKKDKICEICDSIIGVQHNSKTGLMLCGRHYNQIQNHDKILNKTIYDENDIEIKDGYAEIILRNIKFEEVARTLIDIEDIEKIKNIKWYFSKDWGYCCTTKTKNKNFMFLQNFILDKKGLIDHINRNPLDNRKENLRESNKSLNAHNTGIRSNNTSGITGVCWYKNTKRWVARIGIIGKKKIELGNFKDKKNAVIARLQGELKYLGLDHAPQKHLFEEYGIIEGVDNSGG